MNNKAHLHALPYINRIFYLHLISHIYSLFQGFFFISLQRKNKIKL